MLSIGTLESPRVSNFTSFTPCQAAPSPIQNRRGCQKFVCRSESGNSRHASVDVHGGANRRLVLGEIAASAVAAIAALHGREAAWASTVDATGLASHSTSPAVAPSTIGSGSGQLADAESRLPRTGKRPKPLGRVPHATLPCGLRISKVSKQEGNIRQRISQNISQNICFESLTKIPS